MPDPSPHEPVDPSLLDETKADMEAIEADAPPRPPPAPARPPRTPALGAQRSPPAPPTREKASPPARDLADTFDDIPRLVDSPRRGPVPANDVDLEQILDKPDPVYDQASLTRYDPEAGRTSVAVKIRNVSESVRNSIATPFGKLVLSIPVALLGISAAIAAITLQETPYIIAAAILTPLGLFLAYNRYQAWLGHKRYMFRLLETLGEDVSDFDPRDRYRKIKTPGRKRR